MDTSSAHVIFPSTWPGYMCTHSACQLPNAALSAVYVIRVNEAACGCRWTPLWPPWASAAHRFSLVMRPPPRGVPSSGYMQPSSDPTPSANPCCLRQTLTHRTLMRHRHPSLRQTGPSRQVLQTAAELLALFCISPCLPQCSRLGNGLRMALVACRYSTVPCFACLQSLYLCYMHALLSLVELCPHQWQWMPHLFPFMAGAGL